MQALGAVPVPLNYRFAAPAFVYIRGLADGGFAFINNPGFNSFALPRQDRIAALRGFLGGSLALPAPGFDADDLLDRAFFIAMSNRDPEPKGFTDATWAPPPAAAVSTAHPLLGVVAAMVPFLILALWIQHWSGRRRLYLERPKDLPDDPLHKNSMVLAAPAGILKNRTDKAWMSGIARSLNVRQHVAFLTVDPERTVGATIGAGGLFTPIAGEITSSPAYLVFIEAKNGFDQEAQRLEALYLRLIDAGVVAVRYVYFDSPALLHAAWDAPAEPIHDIAAQHNDRRLIILGEGRGYLKPLTLKPEPWALALTLWPDRAMLTPKPIAEWAAEDYAVARELGLPLGRATVEGLAALAELMGLGGNAAPLTRAYGFGQGGDIRPLPAAIRSEPHYWTSETDPDEGDDGLPEWNRLEAALRSYLDTPGLMWLAALAIYPALQWDLTLYLGRNLDLGGAELYAEPRLAALTRLPWLREGTMPEWLRRRMMDLLPEALRLKAIELIWAIMKTQDRGDDVGLVKLKTGAMVPSLGRRPAGDPLFISTITDADGFPLPDHLKPSLASQCRDFLKLQWDKLAIAGLLSLIAWRVTPGTDTLRPGAYMPLTLLFAIPLAAWIFAKIEDGTVKGLLEKWNFRPAMKSVLDFTWAKPVS